MKEVLVVLPNIRSAYNVGSIFRTAEGAGVTKVILTGHTPTPVDRFGRKRKDIAKVALGAEEVLPWEYFKTFEEAHRHLTSKGVTLIAVEQDVRAVSCYEVEVPEKVAYVFGNEVEGLPQDIISVCEQVIEIPMYGKKESLNVSVSVGIILFLQKR